MVGMADVALPRASTLGPAEKVDTVSATEIGRECLCAHGGAVHVCLGAAVLCLELMPLVELLGFGVAHLLLSSVVIECSPALFVAGEYAVIVVFHVGTGTSLRC